MCLHWTNFDTDKLVLNRMWEIKGSVCTDDTRNQEGKPQNNCFCKQKDKIVENFCWILMQTDRQIDRHSRFV